MNDRNSTLQLQGGAAVITITPPLGTPLAGLFHLREARAVESDLTVRALVLNDSTSPLALVVCDLICLRGETVTAARALITERTGIQGDHVMISCTHTHYGPATRDLLIAEVDTPYLEWVVQRIAECVAVAQSRLQSVTVASGSSIVEGVCFNRRFLMKDGTVRFNPGINNPDTIRPVGPTDPEVTSILVEDLDGNAVALWANLSLHYVGTEDECTISADYFGHFARYVERWLGDSCIGMITNGASANINNVDVHQAVETTGSDRARMVARTVAAAAIAATGMQRRRADDVLGAMTNPLTIKRRTITIEDRVLAEQIRSAAPDAEAPVAAFSYVNGQSIPPALRRHFAKEVLHVAELPTQRTTEIQVVKIGETTIVALPGEIFVEFGLELKTLVAHGDTAIVGLANDYVGYVPTREAFLQGGYETWAARSAWTAPGTGEAMVKAIKEMIEPQPDRKRREEVMA